MFKNDFLLDLVEKLGKNIGKSLMDEREDWEQVGVENLSDKEILRGVLNRLIQQRKYNAAENFLFDFVKENKSKEFYEIGEWFYKELEKKDDEILMENNFSRAEVNQGFDDFKNLF